MNRNMTASEFSVGTRYLGKDSEHRHWRDIRALGFTEWYVGRLPKRFLAFHRHAENATAYLFPEYFYQVRTDDGRPVAYLATVPAYWSGDKHALQTYGYYAGTLKFGRLKTRLLTAFYVLVIEMLHMPKVFSVIASRFRERKLSGANCIVLLAMVIDPAYQKTRIPALLFDAVTRTARRLGMKHVLSPFRPNAYGQYKAERRVAHSNALFEEYCNLKNDENLPHDPWLRAVARNGAQFLRIEYRSLTISRSLDRFERFRKNHRPESWYSPIPDTWECGETPTWYVDRHKQVAMSVEPNIWGVVRVDDLESLEQGTDGIHGSAEVST